MRREGNSIMISSLQSPGEKEREVRAGSRPSGGHNAWSVCMVMIAFLHSLGEERTGELAGARPAKPRVFCPPAFHVTSAPSLSQSMCSCSHRSLSGAR